MRPVEYSIFEPPPPGATGWSAWIVQIRAGTCRAWAHSRVDRRPGDTADWRAGYDSPLCSVYGAADDHVGMWLASRRERR
jgi:hypothetical protein